MKTKLEKAYRKAAVKALIQEEEQQGLTELIDASAHNNKDRTPKPSPSCNNPAYITDEQQPK